LVARVIADFLRNSACGNKKLSSGGRLIGSAASDYNETLAVGLRFAANPEAWGRHAGQSLLRSPGFTVALFS
jgi:hypothetical protein